MLDHDHKHGDGTVRV